MSALYVTGGALLGAGLARVTPVESQWALAIFAGLVLVVCCGCVEHQEGSR